MAALKAAWKAGPRVALLVCCLADQKAARKEPSKAGYLVDHLVALSVDYLAVLSADQKAH